MYIANELIKEPNKEIAKIEGLSSIDNKAYSNLQSALSKISEYDLIANSLQESQITIL